MNNFKPWQPFDIVETDGEDKFNVKIHLAMELDMIIFDLIEQVPDGIYKPLDFT